MLRSFLAISLVTASLCPATEVPLTFGPHRDLTLKPQPETVLDISLSEGHPHFWTGIVPKAYDPTTHTVFALEYFAPSGLESIMLRYRVADGSMAVAESLAVPLDTTA